MTKKIKRTFEQAVEVALRNVDRCISVESSEALMYEDKTSDGRRYQVLVKLTTNEDDFQ